VGAGVKRRHLILVGLPGSGKSTVGRLVAEALDAPFVDLDEEIERRAGRSIAEIFARDGERAFRQLELDAARAALAGPPAVLAPGGGFFAADVTRTVARGSGLVVYLATEPAEAAARLGGAAGRPLLEGGPAVARLGALLAERGTGYGEADCTVSTDGRSVADVAAAVVSLARGRAGW
jgi:shikimate kinase